MLTVFTAMIAQNMLGIFTFIFFALFITFLSLFLRWRFLANQHFEKLTETRKKYNKLVIKYNKLNKSIRPEVLLDVV